MSMDRWSARSALGIVGAAAVVVGVWLAFVGDEHPAAEGILADAAEPEEPSSKTGRRVDATVATGSVAAQGLPRPAAIEFPAAWGRLLRFETDEERATRFLRSDPFISVENLPGLLERASKDDSEAALRLHDLAEYCDSHRDIPNLPPDHVRLDCSAPRGWTREQRHAWRRQAVFTGDPSPAMSMLRDVESMAPGDPLRAGVGSEAALSLEYAARRGCLECVVALAELFQSGGSVQQDLRRTFAYLQVAAAANGAAGYADAAEKIRPSLRSIDLEFARALQARLAKALEKNKAR